MNDRERAGEQVAVMDEIVRVADEEAVDAVIVAGDLFDTFNPPVEAIELLYRTLGGFARRAGTGERDLLRREPDDRVAGDANGRRGNLGPVG